MSIGDETRLRSELGSALDELNPGPLPLNAVIRRGRATVLRKRAAAAAAVLLVAAAAVTVPGLLRHLGQHPYHVSVTSPGRTSDPHLIASGRLITDVNNIPWSVEGLGTGRQFHLHWHVYGIIHIYQGGQYVGDVHGGSYNDSYGSPAIPASPASLFDVADSEPDLIALRVRPEVLRVVVSLSNGQTVTLRPVAVLGRGYPSFVAIAVPDETSIRQISAYSATGELGYTVPIGTVRLLPTHYNFDPSGSFEILRWLKPNQPPVPRRADYKIGQGTAYGAYWDQYINVSPSGTCVSPPSGGTLFCFRATGNELTGGKAVRHLDTAYISGDHIGWDALVAEPSVSYIVAVDAGGRRVRVRTYSLLGAKFATLVQTRQNYVIGWIAYSATGTRLASGGF